MQMIISRLKSQHYLSHICLYKTITEYLFFMDHKVFYDH